jgi:hypothetical protein
LGRVLARELFVLDVAVDGPYALFKIVSALPTSSRRFFWISGIRGDAADAPSLEEMAGDWMPLTIVASQFRRSSEGPSYRTHQRWPQHQICALVEGLRPTDGCGDGSRPELRGRILCPTAGDVPARDL